MGSQHETTARPAFIPPSESSPDVLTARQREVLELLCEGLQNKQIARRLNIASATVKIHVANILRVLNVSSRLQAAVVAINLGVREMRNGAAETRPVQSTVPPLRNPAKLRLVSLGEDASSAVTPRVDWSLEAATG